MFLSRLSKNEKKMYYVLTYVIKNVTLSVLMKHGKFDVKTLWKKVLQRFSPPCPRALVPCEMWTEDQAV